MIAKLEMDCVDVDRDEVLGMLHSLGAYDVKTRVINGNNTFTFEMAVDTREDFLSIVQVMLWYSGSNDPKQDVQAIDGATPSLW